MQTNLLLQKMQNDVNDVLNKAETISHYPLQYLSWRQSDQSWSILECMEHLNRYGDFYLPQIKNKIESSSTFPDAVLKSSWLGKYFAKSMLPKEKINKMKTFRQMNPIHADLGKSVVDSFIEQQHELLFLIEKAQRVNLNKIKIETSISRFIKLSLGDTFQFYLNHILRHMQQIERVQIAYENTSPAVV